MRLVIDHSDFVTLILGALMPGYKQMHFILVHFTYLQAGLLLRISIFSRTDPIAIVEDTAMAMLKSIGKTSPYNIVAYVPSNAQ